MKSKRILAVALLLSIVVAGVVSAQGLGTDPSVSIGDNGSASPQKQSTAGRFASDADLFIAPDSYADVEFEKFFAYASYKEGGNAFLGFATRLNDLYIGLAYEGNFFAGMTPPAYTEYAYYQFDGKDKKLKNYDVGTFPSAMPGDPDNVNNIAVLVGVADMGIRLGYYSNFSKFADKEFMVNNGANHYQSYSIEKGLIAPEIAWGMTKGLTDAGIQPWATFRVEFNRDYKKYKEYIQVSPWKVPDGDDAVESDNSTNIHFEAGLGGYDLFEAFGLGWWLDASYTLDLTTYSNEYNYADGTSRKTAKVKGKVTGASTFTEQSENDNEVELALGTGWKGDNYAFKFKFGVPISFGGGKTQGMAPKSTGLKDGLVKSGSFDKESYIGVAPYFAIGNMWDMNDKLSIGFGGKISLKDQKMTTTNSETYGTTKEDTKDEKSETKSVTYETPSTAVEFSVGFTLKPSQNVFLEACTGVSGNALEFFGTSGSGLGSFSQILVGVKF